MENETKHKTAVTIFGHEYSIKGEAPGEYISELAEYVDEKMVNLKRNHLDYTPTQIAILAALNIADEYFQLKQIKVGVTGALEKKTRELISLLDEGLIGEYFSRIDSIGE